MEPKYGILIDLTRCIGCQGCVAACHTGNELALDEQYIEIRENVWGQFPNLRGAFLTHRCYHCGDAACVAVCPTGALYKKYRLTAVDASKCIACGYCVDACPFGVPELVDDKVSKCTGCIELIEQGEDPWCVQTCPSGALKFGSRRDLVNEALDKLESIRAQFPKARIYGKTEAGGLSVFLILPDEPGALDLPEDVDVPALIKGWTRGVQPTSLGTIALSLGFTGFAALFARRQHLQEMRESSAEGVEAIEAQSDPPFVTRQKENNHEPS